MKKKARKEQESKRGKRIDVANHFPLVLVKKWAKRPQKITQKAMKISTPLLTCLVPRLCCQQGVRERVSHSQPVIMAILTQLGTEQNWEEEEQWDYEHYTAHFHTCFTTNGEQVYRFSQLSLNYTTVTTVAVTKSMIRRIAHWKLYKKSFREFL